MAKLTAAQRKKMPSILFGLATSPTGKAGGGFPMNDKKHDRAAISGATRSQNAGNISPSTAAKIKAKARGKLKGK